MVVIRNQRHVSIQSDNGVVAANMLGCIQISILLNRANYFYSADIGKKSASHGGDDHGRMILPRHKS